MQTNATVNGEIIKIFEIDIIKSEISPWTFLAIFEGGQDTYI